MGGTFIAQVPSVGKVDWWERLVDEVVFDCIVTAGRCCCDFVDYPWRSLQRLVPWRPLQHRVSCRQRPVVQSLLKVAIHDGGGATRPDLGRAVQFEGHWIARPNPGRQRAGGAAGAGAE